MGGQVGEELAVIVYNPPKRAKFRDVCRSRSFSNCPRLLFCRVTTLGINDVTQVFKMRLQEKAFVSVETS